VVAASVADACGAERVVTSTLVQFFNSGGIGMSSRVYGAAVVIVTGLVSLFASLASLFLLADVEAHTVPGLIEQVVFGGDPSAGLGVGFLVVAAGMFLIPVDIGAAMLIGFLVYMGLRRRAQV
jgi:hypothetical protein